MSSVSLLLAFAAGILTILSPCVLPLIPVVLSGAAAQHRFAPLALAAGVGLAFALIGAGLASLGFAAGGLAFGGTIFKIVAAVVLVTIGLVLVVPALQERFAVAAGPAGNWLNNRLGTISGNGLAGQFAIGALLGAVWTPCVGPTLGAASLLASRGQHLGQVAITMLVFGLGTGLALAAMGMLSRSVLVAWRGNMMGAGKVGKTVMGVGLMVIGATILTGTDKYIEAYLVDASPLWLTQLTTQF